MLTRTFTLGRRIAALLLLATAILLWTVLAPPSFGGSTTYVVTRGVSMEPHFHTGDLALVRAQPTYHVGDVVAYKSRLLHTIVLHRIVARDGSLYVFKGDNNNFRDPEHPARDQLVGRLWVHVPHGGLDLAPLRDPIVLALLAGLAAWFLLAVPKQRRRRGRRPPAAGPHTETAAVVSGALLVVSLLLAALAFTRATETPSHRTFGYEQNGRFSYWALAAPGAVYPAGRVTTGDPLFVSLVHTARVSFAYRFAAPAPRLIDGRIRLDATVTSTTGWTRRWTLAPVHTFKGDRATIDASLSLTALEQTLRAVEKATGSPPQTYALMIEPHVTTAGVLGGALLQARMTPKLELSIDDTRVAPIQGATFRPVRGGSARLATETARTLRLVKVTLPVATARTLAALGVLAGLLGLGFSLLRIRRGRGAAESERIRARFRDRLIAVASADTGVYTDIVDLETVDELARVAERYDRMILDHNGDFRVADDGVLYRYRVAAAD
jgi:signal peptidase I